MNIIPTVQDIECMHNYIAGPAVSSAVYVAAKLGIADQLMAANLSIEELADKLQVDQTSLYRLMRALTCIDIFKEVQPGIFALTPMAATMCSDTTTSLRGLIILWGDSWYKTTWSGLLHTIQTGEPYFVTHFGMEFFPYIKQNPEANHNFNAAMTSLSSISNFTISKMVDFSQSQHIVDVGGGEGGLLAAILQRYENMRATLFDLPETIQSAKSMIAQLNLADRCEMQAGDFFKEVPSGADTYIIKHVLHGLNDDQSVNVLNSIKKAAQQHARILIIEMMMPESNKPSYSKFNDLGMMLLSKTGKERTKLEFENIIHNANLTLRSITELQMGIHVIETENG